MYSDDGINDRGINYNVLVCIEKDHSNTNTIQCGLFCCLMWGNWYPPSPINKVDYTSWVPFMRLYFFSFCVARIYFKRAWVILIDCSVRYARYSMNYQFRYLSFATFTLVFYMERVTYAGSEITYLMERSNFRVERSNWEWSNRN